MRPAAVNRGNLMAIGRRSKAKTLLLFLSMFILSFFLWVGLLVFSKPHVQGLSQPGSERAPPPQTGSSSAGKAMVVDFEYLPAVVILTSTNGNDRTSERSRVFDALCAGENARLLQKYKFAVHLSIDGLEDVTPLAISSTCTSNGISVEQWYHKSSTAAGFAASGTGRVAAHYKQAMKRVFAKHTHVIFLEDDLVPSFDFMSLFIPESPAFQALQSTPREVWCVSAWNDMGVSTHASNLERLFRTDFFPGLGWMTTQAIYHDSIRKKWIDAPTTGWDNWLRSNNDEQRDCIVPEVNRVKHISSRGVNVQDPGNSVYGVFSFPPDNSRAIVNWKLEGGNSVEKYELIEHNQVQAATRVNFYNGNTDIHASQGNDVLIVYERSQLTAVLRALGANPPMLEPRGGRKGLIAFRKISDGHFYLLCDLVQCAPRFFPKEVFFPRRSLMARGSKGVSCTVTCLQHGKKCDSLTLQTIAYPPGSACVLMRTYFDCPLGCGHQMGAELPAVVVDKTRDTAGQCLTGESVVSTCDSSHPATRRLCACVD